MCAPESWDAQGGIKHLRCDYKPTYYTIRHVDLTFELDKDETVVKSTMTLALRGSGAKEDLRLDGENLELVSVSVGGKDLAADKNQYHFGGEEDPDCIVIHGSEIPDLKNADETFQVQTVVKNKPAANLKLEGLYFSRGILTTQCEAMGFRRITYFLDRPDVMARYQVRLEGDKSLYPVLLSNGNEVEKGDLKDGKHFAVFNDPFPKPSYLFAVCAGPLHCIESTYKTMATDQPSRNVRIRAWSEEQYLPRLSFALSSVTAAMKFDEDRFGRAYDLGVYNIVAISDFNMGAMENKSLNIFNTSCLLSSAKTATDAQFLNVLRVVGHEYFHNWTGNRITCRDWFQLTLKEGLTVFREQEFTRYSGGSIRKRVGDIQVVRAVQFPEDSGPMAHPIRPESYVDMNNFYTSTVYSKGAEVIRMYQSLLGNEGFRKGMDLYFKRHDGCAVTCDDFRNAMGDANGVNLAQFENWYLQKGTPEVVVDKWEWKPNSQTFEITISQVIPKNATTTGEPGKPFHIPIRFGLISRVSHKDLIKETVLELKEENNHFEIPNVTEDCVPSILRDFSAPIVLRPFLSDDDLAFLTLYDTDAVTKWDSFQTLSAKIVLSRACEIRDKNTSVENLTALPEYVYSIYKHTLDTVDKLEDMSVAVYTLGLPLMAELKTRMKPCDPIALFKARESIMFEIAVRFRPELLTIYSKLSSEIEGKDVSAENYDVSTGMVGKRSMRNFCLSYLGKAEVTEGAELAWKQFEKSEFMNDKFASYSILVDLISPRADESITEFKKFADGDDLMLDSWLSAQARCTKDGSFERFGKLLELPEFAESTNPNRIRAVLGSFAVNLPIFHQVDGKGYDLVATQIVRVDKFNSQVACAVAKQFMDYKCYDETRQTLMKKALKKISEEPGLSKGLQEVVSTGLKD